MVSPVTSGDAVKGYIVIHCYLSKIERECNSVLNISYFTLLVILGLSLILVFGFWRLISCPLDRLIYAAGKYAAGNLDIPSSKSPLTSSNTSEPASSIWPAGPERVENPRENLSPTFPTISARP